MIGVSLPFAYLVYGGAPYGSRTLFFEKLRQAGVESVELRNVTHDAIPGQVRETADRLWGANLQITVHGGVRTPETAVEDVFSPLRALLPALRQKELVIVIHPTVGSDDTLVEMLGRMAAHIRKEALPVRIALENNRKMPDGSRGDSAELVARLVNRLDVPEVGICFDMGHYYWAVDEKKDRLPPQAFLNRIIHTHIHALHEGRTHFPLGRYDLPLEEYIAAFSTGYTGRYNIELEDARYKALVPPEEAMFGSIQALRAALSDR